MPVPIAVAPMLISRSAPAPSPSRSTSSGSCREGRELLAERHRHGVLQLRAAHLDDARELLALVPRTPRRARAIAASASRLASADAELQRRRIDVVRRLDAVDVVVRVQDARSRRARGPSSSSARFAITSLAFMFVDVPAPPWIMSTRNCSCCLPARDLVAAPARSRRAISASSSPELAVRQRRRLLHAASASTKSGEFAQRHAGDREILERAQRLHAVQASSGTSRSPSRSCSRRGASSGREALAPNAVSESRRTRSASRWPIARDHAVVGVGVPAARRPSPRG